MIKESQYFLFNHIRSIDMSVVNVNTEGGLQEENFLAGKTINETFLKDRPEPIVDSIVYEPFEMPLNFYVDQNIREGFYKNRNLTQKKLREIAKWLTVTDYSPLSFSSNLDIVYYAIPLNAMDLVHNCSEDGYIRLTMKVLPFKYSTKISTPWINPSNKIGNILTFDNKGDITVPLSMEIQKIGDGNVTITNLSAYRTPFTIDDLKDREILKIDSVKELMESSLNGYECYEQSNESYVFLGEGQNRIKVEGSCLIRFNYRFKYY
ncbi:phage tail domain-containing protein [Bacillus pumilus]|uniref:Phage tail protein n=1 Tax=Bacillus pumilus TaxID=1408 RepID=A0AAD0HN69_BACPU|nr:phage tail domain-containing protein [Bacillus pumilus]AVM24339.1 phage tail protein [Bacillus pumilus]TYS42750.1 phage tail protein [Bacillus pumilus]